MLEFLGTIGGWFGLDPVSKLAKAAGGVLLLITVAAFILGAKAIYDANVIEAHETRQSVQTEKADRKADTNAAEQRRKDEARGVQEARELEKVQANAQTDIDRRLARHRCLRMQQDARAEGEPPPNC